MFTTRRQTKAFLILGSCIISTIQCLQLNRAFRTVEFWSQGILTGFDTSRFRNAFKLKQIVKFHTRGNQTLDFVLTNIKGFYEEPIKRPALGLSDNASVELQPLSRCKTQPSKRSIITRDQRESHRVAPSSYLDWPCKELGYMWRENARRMYTRTRTYTNKNLPVLYMTYISVLKKLSALNTNKASGPDRIPSWVLKENADVLAAPVADILNSSFLKEYTPPEDLTC